MKLMELVISINHNKIYFNQLKCSIRLIMFKLRQILQRIGQEAELTLPLLKLIKFKSKVGKKRLNNHLQTQNKTSRASERLDF